MAFTCSLEHLLVVGSQAEAEAGELKQKLAVEQATTKQEQAKVCTAHQPQGRQQWVLRPQLGRLRSPALTSPHPGVRGLNCSHSTESPTH